MFLIRFNKAFRQIAPGFLVLLLAFMLLRLVFHIYNADLLPPAGGWPSWLTAYYWGFRYDLAVLVIVLTPVFLLLLLNSVWLNKSWLASFARLIMWIAGSVLILVSVADIPYFRFNGRRATREVFDLIRDTTSAFSSFLLEFLLFVLLTFVLIVILGKASGIVRKHREQRSFLPMVVTIVAFLFGVNFGLPLTPKNITFRVSPEYGSVVSNTPMSLGYSILKGQEALEAKNYFTDPAGISDWFSIHHRMTGDTDMNKRSVVIFVLESFSREYFVEGHINKAPMPFLDSLMEISTVFTNAYANGTTSAYGLMSVLGGIPPFMDEPYFSSIYSQNKIKGIGSLLKDAGYSCSFFYGAEDDHYGFRKNMTLLGIDAYYSMEDFPGKAYDGHWGIYDGPFLGYAASQLRASQKPVFSTIFNISTHFPYMVPEEYRSELPMGNLPSHQSMAYTDLALRGFFDSIASDPEMKDALYLFIADHWAKMREMEDKSAVGIYRIPFFIYDPLDPAGREIHHIVQQVDVVPTILDLLNYSGPWMSFGTSVFREDQYRFTYNEFENIYRIIDSTYVLAYDERREKSFSLHNHSSDPGLLYDLLEEKPGIAQEMETRLRAVIQSYNNGLVHNDLWPKE